MAKKKAEPYFTIEQAKSLVQGEEHRLLLRHGKPAISCDSKAVLVKRVANSGSFEQGLQVIADAI